MTKLVNFAFNADDNVVVKHYVRDIEKVDMEANGGFAAIGKTINYEWLKYTQTSDSFIIETDDMGGTARVDDDMRPFMFAISMKRSDSPVARAVLLFLPNKYVKYMPIDLREDTGSISIGSATGVGNLSVIFFLTPNSKGLEGEQQYQNLFVWAIKVINDANVVAGRETHPYKLDTTYNAYKMAAVVALALYAAEDKIDRESNTSRVYSISAQYQIKKKSETIQANGFTVTLPENIQKGTVVITSSSNEIVSIKTPFVRRDTMLTAILDVHPAYKPDVDMAVFLMSQAAILHKIAATYEIMAAMGQEEDEDEEDDYGDNGDISDETSDNNQNI